jgi:hypothetical protein
VDLDPSDPEVVPAEAPPRATWHWYWDEGIRYDLELPFEEYWIGPDEGPLQASIEKRLAFVGRIGGRLQVDAAAYEAARGLDPVDGGIELRRLRLGTRGDFYLLAHVSYAFDVDIVGNDLEPGDAYLWWTDVPFVRGVKIGNFTPAFSLESVTSGRDLVFMETGLPVSAFGPARSAGGSPRRRQGRGAAGSRSLRGGPVRGRHGAPRGARGGVDGPRPRRVRR